MCIFQDRWGCSRGGAVPYKLFPFWPCKITSSSSSLLVCIFCFVFYFFFIHLPHCLMQIARLQQQYNKDFCLLAIIFPLWKGMLSKVIGSSLLPKVILALQKPNSKAMTKSKGKKQMSSTCMGNLLRPPHETPTTSPAPPMRLYLCSRPCTGGIPIMPCQALIDFTTLSRVKTSIKFYSRQFPA